MVTEMYQVSTLQALAKGDFYGNATIGELLTKGDIGLGTFKAVDGEMIVLDGKCYRAKADGTVELAADSDSTPFASVTYLNKDIFFKLESINNMEELLAKLDVVAKANGENNIYACRVDGYFTEVYARSEKSSIASLIKLSPRFWRRTSVSLSFKMLVAALCAYIFRNIWMD